MIWIHKKLLSSNNYKAILFRNNTYRMVLNTGHFLYRSRRNSKGHRCGPTVIGNKTIVRSREQRERFEENVT